MKPIAIAAAAGYPDYISRALRSAGFGERKYQIHGVLEAWQLLGKGVSVELVLPPGTGKTLIAQILTCMWLRESSPGSCRVLTLLPTSILREQHYAHCCSWTSSLCSPLDVSRRWLESSGPWHPNVVAAADSYFALPLSLRSAIRDGKFPVEVWDQVGLVICDEYDAFSIDVLKASGMTQRFHANMRALVPYLKRRERVFLLSSATPVDRPPSVNALARR